MKRILTPFFTILFSFTAVIAYAGFFDDLGSVLSDAGKAIDKSIERRETKFESGLKGTLLENIFLDSPYDSNRKGDDQWPRVALTVHNEPSFHTGYVGTNTCCKKGCWKLSAVIWYDSKTSKKVAPFDWCSPDHVVYGVALADSLQWFIWGADLSFAKTTGFKRTNGPIPPSKPIPSDVRHKRHLKHSNMSASSYDGLMLSSVLFQMGLDWSVLEDKRVWVTTFENANK